MHAHFEIEIRLHFQFRLFLYLVLRTRSIKSRETTPFRPVELIMGSMFQKHAAVNICRPICMIAFFAALVSSQVEYVDSDIHWALTRYKLTQFSLFDHGFQQGQILKMLVNTSRLYHRISFGCADQAHVEKTKSMGKSQQIFLSLALLKIYLTVLIH
jgi:hypothetical protein